MFKSLLAVVLFTHFSIGAFAQTIPFDNDNAECDFGSDVIKLSETFTFLESKCLSVPAEERCSCLANEKESNLFVTAIDDKENKVLAYQKKVRAERTAQFWDVYKQMIHGAAFQAESLFSKDHKKDEKVVGCPPVDIAKNFKTKLKDGIEEMKDLQEDALKARSKEFKACVTAKGVENCRWLEKQVAKLQADYDKKKKATFDSYCGDAEESNNEVSAQIQLNSAKNWYKENPTAKDSQTKLIKIDCLLLLSDKKDDAEKNYKDLKCPDVIGFPGNWGEESQSQMVKGTKACGRDAAEFHFLMEELDQDKSKAEEENLSSSITFADEPAQQNIKHSSECEGDSLCESFERTNQAAFNSMKDTHKLGPGQCIPYSLFLLRKGIPGDLFLAQLAAIPEDRADKMGDLLLPPKVVANEQDRQRLNFLKANPLLFKLTQNENTRKTLGQELQKIAKSAENKTPAQKMDNYLKFMKGPVKKAMDSDSFKVTQDYICEQMINHFTGVVMATDLPDPKKTSDIKLVDAILACKVALNNLTSVTDTRNLTDYSDLFRKVEGDLPELSDEEAYKKMNQEECGDLDDFALNNCKGKKMTQAQCADSYRAQKPGNDGVEEVIRNNNVTPNLGAGNFQSASRYSRSEHQDTKFLKSYRKRVGKLSTPAVPFKGKTEEYAEAMQDDQSKVASVSAAVASSNRSLPSYMQEKSSDGQTYSRPSGNSVNPGQIFPSYTEPGTFIPEKMSPQSNVTKAIQDYDWLAPDKKIESLTKAKNYLEENDLKNLDDEVEDEKISQIDHEIKKEKEKSSGSTGGTEFSTNVNTLGGGTTGASNGGVMSGGASSAGAGASISAPQVGHGAVNDAIVKNHEKREGNIPPTTPIQIRPGQLSESDLKSGSLEITQELLVNSSELSVLSQSPSALEAYLRQNLREEDLKEEKIISIADSNGGLDAPKLIFLVKFENGKYVVQSMPGTVPVKRSVTLKHLKFNLEGFKGLKKQKKAI